MARRRVYRHHIPAMTSVPTGCAGTSSPIANKLAAVATAALVVYRPGPIVGRAGR